MKIAKIDHDAKAVALAKWSLWVKILKMRAKNRSKKHLIYILQPMQNTQFGQKIKLLKICEKRLYKQIKVVLCKKWLEKTANIRKMRPF